MSNEESYRLAYLHFNFRLEERYGFVITFDEYMSACRGLYEDTGIKSSPKRKLVWVMIRGHRVLSVKQIGRTPCALITALPPGNIYRKKYDGKI